MSFCRRRLHEARLFSGLWAFLIALSLTGAPVLHSAESAQHAFDVSQDHGPSTTVPQLAESGGSFHDHGCPHVPLQSHHDSNACLTCRTLHQGRYSALAATVELAAALPRGSFLSVEQRSVPVFADLRSAAPRAPPSFS